MNGLELDASGGTGRAAAPQQGGGPRGGVDLRSSRQGCSHPGPGRPGVGSEACRGNRGRRARADRPRIQRVEACRVPRRLSAWSPCFHGSTSVTSGSRRPARAPVEPRSMFAGGLLDRATLHDVVDPHWDDEGRRLPGPAPRSRPGARDSSSVALAVGPRSSRNFEPRVGPAPPTQLANAAARQEPKIPAREKRAVIPDPNAESRPNRVHGDCHHDSGTRPKRRNSCTFLAVSS